MKTRTILLTACLLATAPTMAGCVECEPDPVDASVEMAVVDEELRTLPVHASGGTSVALPPGADADVETDGSPQDASVDADASLEGEEEVELPDSHGYLDVEVAITHRIERVDVRELTLEVLLDDEPLSVDVTNVEGGSDWQQTEAEGWQGEVGNGSVLRVWWTVDEPEHRRWLALADEADSDYQATLTASWQHESCSWQASGTSRESSSAFVRAVADAGSLTPVDEPRVTVNGTNVGFQADYEVTTGLELAIDDVQATGVYAGSGPAGGARGVVFPNVAHNGTGDDDRLQANETLRVHSAATPAARAEYEASGLLVPAPTQAPEHVLLVVAIDYEPTDETAGTEQQILAHAVEPGSGT